MHTSTRRAASTRREHTTGKVTKAGVCGDPISPQSAACLKTTEKSLVLSPPVLTPGGR